MPRLAEMLKQARNPRLLIASAVIGIAVGLMMAVFVSLALHVMLDFVSSADLTVLVIAPAIGMMTTQAFLMAGGRITNRGISNSTSDEYLRAFHERRPQIPIIELPIKLLAGITTIGGGGAVGLEAPSIYTGSSLGLFLHEKLSQYFKQDEAHILLTAGAAAGVSAAFKTPATGVIFALEAPYRDDVAPQALVPSLISSAASYTTLVAFLGAEPLVPFLSDGLASSNTDVSTVLGLSNPHLENLRGALILGIIAGLAGRGFAWLIHHTKRAAIKTTQPQRVATASLVLAVLALISHETFGQALSLGSGIEAMSWVFEEETLILIALLFAIRVLATLATVYGGGVGGLFIPLCTLGVIVGQFVGAGIVDNTSGLYPTLGLAAFLGAGYHTPIAGVIFVAESTQGSGAFIVPALIAAAVSQVVCGPLSVAEHQRGRRLGHIENRLSLPLSSIINTDVFTVPPDATVSEFMYMHVLGRRERVVPVVKNSAYLGMARMTDVSPIERDSWETVEVQEIMVTHLSAARPSWSLRDAVVAMDKSDTDILAVVDNSDNFIGVVTEYDVVKLGEILDATEE